MSIKALILAIINRSHMSKTILILTLDSSHDWTELYLVRGFVSRRGGQDVSRYIFCYSIVVAAAIQCNKIDLVMLLGCLMPEHSSPLVQIP